MRSARFFLVTATKNCMSDSYDPPKNPPESAELHEPTALYDLDLPVAPAWFSEEPSASWKAGYDLSLEVLRDALKRPEIWEERDREMVSAEFVWKEN